jgi:23S rRNA (adenine1618-N6)-methyltransferase
MARTPRPARPRPPLTPADGLHPDNPHRGRYDFPALLRVCPELARFLRPHPIEGDTIDFARPAAVLALNRALLLHHYGLTHWELPPGSLCQPIPGRADYLHHLAALLRTDPTETTPAPVRALDIGTGASCIYPIIGASALGWHFVATDIDPASIAWARRLVASNPALAGRIECRHQPDPTAIFKNVTSPGEKFDVSLCNPPFHASAFEADAGTLRKLRNLGSVAGSRDSAGRPVLNFGGRANELWCPGGELAFVGRLITESAARPALCRWFTSLVAKSAHLPMLQAAAEKSGAAEVRVLGMRHGQKHSRILAWRFPR